MLAKLVQELDYVKGLTDQLPFTLHVIVRAVLPPLYCLFESDVSLLLPFAYPAIITMVEVLLVALLCYPVFACADAPVPLIGYGLGAFYCDL